MRGAIGSATMIERTPNEIILKSFALNSVFAQVHLECLRRFRKQNIIA